jgi:excisionase family DNA binding protein
LFNLWISVTIVDGVGVVAYPAPAMPGVRVVPAGDRLLTVSEVAAAMRVSNMTIYRLIKSGELPAVRVGRSYRIREGDVAAYLARGTC